MLKHVFLFLNLVYRMTACLPSKTSKTLDVLYINMKTSLPGPDIFWYKHSIVKTADANVFLKDFSSKACNYSEKKYLTSYFSFSFAINFHEKLMLEVCPVTSRKSKTGYCTSKDLYFNSKTCNGLAADTALLVMVWRESSYRNVPEKLNTLGIGFE